MDGYYQEVIACEAHNKDEAWANACEMHEAGQITDAELEAARSTGSVSVEDDVLEEMFKGDKY